MGGIGSRGGLAQAITRGWESRLCIPGLPDKSKSTPHSRLDDSDMSRPDPMGHHLGV